MRTLIPWLFGLFVGWTCGAVYIALHEDHRATQLEEERALRLQAQQDARRAFDRQEVATGEMIAAKLELDAVRRNWMRERERWWVPPTDERADRIPPQAVPER